MSSEFLGYTADWTSHMICPDVHEMESRMRDTLSSCAVISDFRVNTNANLSLVFMIIQKVLIKW